MKNELTEMMEELKSLSPMLTKLKTKGDGLTVPPGYFETLDASILDKIKETGVAREKTASHGWRIWLRDTRMIAAAAILLLAVGAWWFYQPVSPASAPTNYQALANEITPEEAADYVFNNLQEFESATLGQYAVVENTRYQPGTTEKSNSSSNPTTNSLDEISPSDLNIILDDLTDEELEAIL